MCFQRVTKPHAAMDLVHISTPLARVTQHFFLFQLTDDTLHCSLRKPYLRCDFAQC